MTITYAEAARRGTLFTLRVSRPARTYAQTNLSFRFHIIEDGQVQRFSFACVADCWSQQYDVTPGLLFTTLL